MLFNVEAPLKYMSMILVIGWGQIQSPPQEKFHFKATKIISKIMDVLDLGMDTFVLPQFFVAYWYISDLSSIFCPFPRNFGRLRFCCHASLQPWLIPDISLKYHEICPCKFLNNFNYIWISFTFFYNKTKYEKITFLDFFFFVVLNSTMASSNKHPYYKGQVFMFSYTLKSTSLSIKISHF